MTLYERTQEPSTELPDLQCLMCGVPMHSFFEAVPCPDGRVGCAVAHYGYRIRCAKCGSTGYQRLADDRKSGGSDG